MNGQRKVAIITGANGSMGSEEVRAVAKAGYEVVMACRNLDKARPTYEALQKELGTPLSLLHLDLASFEVIKAFANEIKSRYQHIDLLLNNAGALCHFPKETAEHIEYTVGVNYLGHYLNTHLLLPLMGEGSRIVNMVSLTYKYAHIPDNIFVPRSKKDFNRFTVYGNSKLAFFYFTMDAAEKWKARGITVNCADPGIVSTNIIRQGNRIIDKLCDIFYRPLIKTPAQGADTMLYLALAEETKNLNGVCYRDRKPIKTSEKLLNHPQREKLREMTQNLLKQHGFEFQET